MKILMFGAGVINTLYAWAFSKNGHDVSLLVRPGREANWKDGLRLNIIDHRTGKDVTVNEVFAPRVVSQFSPTDNYDFIIESVKHTQTEGILPQIKQNAGNAIVVFFNNNWRGVDFIDEHFDKTKYVLAMPRAGALSKRARSTARSWMKSCSAIVCAANPIFRQKWKPSPDKIWKR